MKLLLLFTDMIVTTCYCIFVVEHDKVVVIVIIVVEQYLKLSEIVENIEGIGTTTNVFTCGGE